MADRYWVGGTATWDATAGTKWSATDGGAGGASVPTAADAVFFTALSGTVTCTVSGTRVAQSINCTGFTGTLAGTATPALTLSGSLTLVAGMTLTYNGTTTFNATATITSAGKTLGPVTISGSGITVTLGDALNIGSNLLTVTQGTFTTSASNYSVTAGQISSNNSNTRSILLNGSTVTLSASTPLDFTTITNLTFNAGTSSIICNASFGVSFNGSALTYYDVSFTGTNMSSHGISGTNTFNNLAITGPSSAGTCLVNLNPGQTINGILSTTGTAGNRRILFVPSGVIALSYTLTINSTPSITDVDFKDIIVIGTAAPISGTRIGNLGNCTGITFSTPKTVYWVFVGALTWNSASAWSDTSTGAASANFYPLAQDTATFTNDAAVTTVTIGSSVQYIGSIDMSPRTGTVTISVTSPTTVYGNWKNGSGTTISGASALTFSGDTTKTITSAGKTFTCPITVNNYIGSVELADALNIGGNTLTVTNGAFDTKNFNVTAGALSSNNSNVRTINLGSSTITLSSTSPVVLSTTTNLTFNAGTSQINVTSGSNPTVAPGGLTFYNLSFTDTTGGTRSITGTNTNTFNNLSVTASSTEGITSLVHSGNQIITGTLTVAGATAVRRIFVRSSTLGTQRTLSVGTLSATDCDFRDIAITGAAAGSSPTRAGDCGGNSGITFPAAKTVYWNLAGAQNWSATGWCPSSGGTPDINQFPLAQDTAVFDNTGSVTGTITINAAWNIGTFDASARTSAMTLTTGSNTPFVYGDWKFGTGVSSSLTTGTITFVKRGTQTITSNGVQFGCPVTIDSIDGTVQLADALSLNSSRALTLTSGTFDAVSYNVTTGRVVISGLNRRTLKMGSGTWTLSGNSIDGTVWDAGTTTNLNFYKNTANIVLSDTSTNSRTFAGGSLSYNKLTIGGTTGISTLTITGDNQFTELASTKTVAHTIALGTTTQTFGRWTVTGTVGNVVTLTGTGTSHILAGACTSGINYLAMGSIGFAATSPGEFYAGVNSTGTAAAPVYRTAKPADSTRYWVGGTGNWSSTTRWSASSGGASGASVPRSHDDVIFNSASSAAAYTVTVNTVTGGIRMKSLTIAGPASGNVTLAGTVAIDGIHGNVTLPATGLTRTYSGDITLSSNSTGLTFTTNGVTLASAITINGVDCSWSLGSALNNSSSAITLTNGTLNLATYNLTAGSISSNNGNTRTINFSSGTTTLSGVTPIGFGFGTTDTSRTTLTVVADTSQINCSASAGTFSGNDKTFYNVSFTGTSPGTFNINGTNTFNNLSFTGLTSAGLKIASLTANQTVTGTLTFSAGTNATMRHFCRGAGLTDAGFSVNSIGTTRTITAAAVSMTDVDFRDITIAGAAAPASGTRIADCKGNSGITFTAAANKYWNLAAGGNWSATGWATTSGGSPAVNNFPLAQDTCFFEATGLNSGATVTIDQSYNIGTIDMSARTTNTMTLATGTTTPFIYGNWINGTGTTLTGTAAITFSGQGSQTLTSAGRTFTQLISINSPSGSLTLQDAFVASQSSATVLSLLRGTFNAATYNVTLSGASSGVSSSNDNTRTIAIGSGTWTISGTTSPWDVATSTNLTVTGTGTISLTSASAKTFAGGGVAYTDITLNQGGAGTLTITGNNTFKDITNTYKSTGATTINIGSTTQRVSQFTAAGELGRLLTLTGTSVSFPATLILTGAGTVSSDFLTLIGNRVYSLIDTWYAGTNSTNDGTLGWIFTAAPTPVVTSSNFLMFFFP